MTERLWLMPPMHAVLFYFWKKTRDAAIDAAIDAKIALAYPCA